MFNVYNLIKKSEGKENLKEMVNNMFKKWDAL